MKNKFQLLKSVKTVIGYKYKNHGNEVIKYLKYLSRYLCIKEYIEKTFIKDNYKFKVNEISFEACINRSKKSNIPTYTVTCRYYNKECKEYLVLDIVTIDIDKSVSKNLKFAVKKIEKTLKQGKKSYSLVI